MNPNILTLQRAYNAYLRSIVAILMSPIAEDGTVGPETLAAIKDLAMGVRTNPSWKGRVLASMTSWTTASITANAPALTQEIIANTPVSAATLMALAGVALLIGVAVMK